MRILPIASAGLALAVLAGGVSVTAVGASHHSTFSNGAAALEQQWNTDQAEGVPAASLEPLRQTLHSSQYSAGWWMPYWWTNTGQQVLSDLHTKTDAAWAAAMAGARTRAQAQITSWAQLEQQLGQYVPAADTQAAKAWPAKLKAAGTPAAIDALTAAWAKAVQSVTQVAQQAQQTAQLNAAVAGEGGVQGLLDAAQKAVSAAQGVNLDTGQVPALITQLQSQVRANVDATATIKQLLDALGALRSLIQLNDNVASGFRPVMLLIDQALAEGDSAGNGFNAEYSAASGALHDATTAPQLQAVQTRLANLHAQVDASLAANQCGHSVGGGKVITVNLSLQEAIFYQDGCVVQATPITTGRAQLRTPTGNFHVFFKQSPFQFISPWPKDSPFYYYPSWVSWVMEFAGGGYFLHDAPWEPNWEYGPGSENSGGASHGCIHIPTPVMQWAYQWTPNGTPVLITY